MLKCHSLMFILYVCNEHESTIILKLNYHIFQLGQKHKRHFGAFLIIKASVY